MPSYNNSCCRSNCQPNNPQPCWNTNDYGPAPFVFDIEEDTRKNPTFRTTRWTGTYMQLTLMCIPKCGEIGLEIHPHVDQFIRIEEGEGMIFMGNGPNNLYIRQQVYDGIAILIPANTWHNLINTGDHPLKLYSIYAPIQHPAGTVHWTKADEDH